jgi:Flp pilus assembly pilin Flp
MYSLIAAPLLIVNPVWGIFAMTKIHFRSVKAPGTHKTGSNQTGSIMNQTDQKRWVPRVLLEALDSFHRDTSGVAMTEYIMVFTLISFGSTVALLATAAYIKAYRDFLVWWLGHPAV